MNLENINVKDLTATNYKAAEIFEQYGIDFCCNGNITLKDVCIKKNIILDEISAKLNSLSFNDYNYDEWDLDFLVSYIVKTHHNYVKKNIPLIKNHLIKIVNVHGVNHPELKQISSLFDSLSDELLSHLNKEEKILFPVINQLVALKDNHEVPAGKLSIQKPIEVMESEHQNAGSILAEIKTLSNNYTVPSDGCNTFKVAYEQLKDFEKDLHKHIFLENWILFPKSIALEKELEYTLS